MMRSVRISAKARVAGGMMRIAAALACATAAGGWTVTGTVVETSHYLVSARSHAEFVSAVRRAAPRSGTAFGHAIIDFFPTYLTMPAQGKGCRVGKVEVGLRIQLRVPKWRPASGTPKSVARRGRHFERTILAHEQHHVAIAKRFAVRMRTALGKMKTDGDCWQLRREANERIARLKKQHLAAQKAFDKRSYRQMKRLL